MPGMLETVHAVGLNADRVEGLVLLTGKPRLTWDSYRRFVQGSAEVVLGLLPGPFDEIMAHAAAEAQVDAAAELDHRSLRRATKAMLEGSPASASASPATGAREIYFDVVFNGQGEDVVAGRQVLPDGAPLRRRLPGVLVERERMWRTLERLFGDVQDFWFTLQSGSLWLLQTRRVTRTPWAALRIAVDLVRRETTTADIAGLAVAAGILNAAGGRTAQAAAMARQLGKVCLVASPDLSSDLARRLCRIGGGSSSEGDFLSLDGNDGAVYAGRLLVVAERPERELAIVESRRAKR